jgi:hypothetical protein
VLRRALSPRPGDRYSTCDELVRKLSEALDGPVRQTPPLDPPGSSRQTPPMDLRATMIPGMDTTPMTDRPTPIPTPWTDVEPVIPLTKSAPVLPAAQKPSWVDVESPPAGNWRGTGPRSSARTGPKTDRPRDTDPVSDGSFQHDPIAIAPPRSERVGKKKGGALVAIGVAVVLIVAVGGAAAYVVATQMDRSVVETEPTKPGESNGEQPKPGPANTNASSGTGNTEPTNKGTANGGGADGPGSKDKKGTNGGGQGTATPPQKTEEERQREEKEKEYKQKEDKQKEALKQARESFAKLDVQGGLKFLVDMPKEPTGNTWKEAEALRLAWENAQGEKYNLFDPKMAPAKFVESLRESAKSPLNSDDQNALDDYARGRLAMKVKATVLGSPQPKAEWWRRLGEAAEQAYKSGLTTEAFKEFKPWVAACLSECTTELTLEGQKVDFPTPKVADTAADGYGRYGRLVQLLAQALSDEPKEPADEVVKLVRAELAAKHTWASDYRFGRLAHLLFAARAKSRIADVTNLSEPYKLGDVADVIAWLGAAEDAAKQAKGQIAPKPEEIQYERALAEYVKSTRGKDKNKTALGKAVAAVPPSYLEDLAKKNPPARGRFWVIDALTKTDKKGELESLGKAWDVLSNPGKETVARFTYDEVVYEVKDAAEVATEDEKTDPERLKALAELVAKIGRGMHTSNSWEEKWNVTKAPTPKQEAADLLAVAALAYLKSSDVEKAKENAYQAADWIMKEPKTDPDRVRSRVAHACGEIGWRLLDAGYKEPQDSDARKKLWSSGRKPLEQALRLLAEEWFKSPEGWQWRFALGTVIRGERNSEGIAKTKAGGEFTPAEFAQRANDYFLAANFVRSADYFAYNQLTTDKERKASAIHDKERNRTYASCKAALDKAVETLPEQVERPLWQLAALEMSLVLGDQVLTTKQKADLDKWVPDAEAAISKIKDKDKGKGKGELFEAEGNYLIKRLRVYKVQGK